MSEIEKNPRNVHTFPNVKLRVTTAQSRNSSGKTKGYGPGADCSLETARKTHELCAIPASTMCKPIYGNFHAGLICCGADVWHGYSCVAM